MSNSLNGSALRDNGCNGHVKFDVREKSLDEADDIARALGLVEYFSSLHAGTVPRSNNLVERAIHWALTNGFVLVPKGRPATELPVVSFMPFTIVPTPLERRHFDQICSLQPHVNELVRRLATSTDTLREALGDLIDRDSFVKSLWRIYTKAQTEGYNQSIFLEVLRTDYMLHEEQPGRFHMKQVEINTISPGGSFISSKATELHK